MYQYTIQYSLVEYNSRSKPNTRKREAIQYVCSSIHTRMYLNIFMIFTSSDKLLEVSPNSFLKASSSCTYMIRQSCRIFPSLRLCHARFVQRTLSKVINNCPSWEKVSFFWISWSLAAVGNKAALQITANRGSRP
nr:hypothetical protein Iba_chr09aCG5910 [Ipomoea batatas]